MARRLPKRPKPIKPVQFAQPQRVQVPLLRAATTGPSGAQLAEIVKASPAATEKQRSLAEQAEAVGKKQAGRGMRPLNYLSTFWSVPASIIREIGEGDIAGLGKEVLGALALAPEAMSFGLVPATEAPLARESTIAKAYQGTANYAPSVLAEHWARQQEATKRGVPVEQVKWSDVSGSEKTAARVAGFGLDVVGDPLTYVTFGMGKAAVAIAKPLGKEALVVVSKEVGEEAAEAAARQAAKNLGKEAFTVTKTKYGSALTKAGGEALEPGERNAVKLALEAAGHQAPDKIKFYNPVDFAYRFGAAEAENLGRATGQYGRWGATVAGSKLGTRTGGKWTIEGILKSAEGGARYAVPLAQRKGRGVLPVMTGRRAHEIGAAAAKAVKGRPLLEPAAEAAGKATRALSRGMTAELRQAYRAGAEELTPIVRSQL